MMMCRPEREREICNVYSKEIKSKPTSVSAKPLPPLPVAFVEARNVDETSFTKKTLHPGTEMNTERANQEQFNKLTVNTAENAGTSQSTRPVISIGTIEKVKINEVKPHHKNGEMGQTQASIQSAGLRDKLRIDFRLFQGCNDLIKFVQPALEKALGLIVEFYNKLKSECTCIKILIDKVKEKVEEEFVCGLTGAFLHDALSRVKVEVVFPEKEKQVAANVARSILVENQQIIHAMVKQAVLELYSVDHDQMKKEQSLHIQIGEEQNPGAVAPIPGSVTPNDIIKHSELVTIGIPCDEQNGGEFIEWENDELGARQCCSRMMGGCCAIMIIFVMVVVTTFMLAAFL